MKKRVCSLGSAALAALTFQFVSCGGAGPRDVRVTSVSLDKGALVLGVGAREALSATVLPADASTKNVSWSSSRASVAAVSGDGLVVAAAGGAATITATTWDGGKTATCAVTVIVPVTGVSLSPRTMSLVVGPYGSTAGLLHANVQPSNATNKDVSWTSSDEAVASVGGSGDYVAVNGNRPGKAVITVTTRDGGWTATCAVTVTAAGGAVNPSS